MSDKSNLFLIIFIVLTLIAVYFWYTQFRNVDVSVTMSSAGENQLVGREFVFLINKLRAISIDSGFFGDERFTSLKDLTPTIKIPEKFGRSNPFASIGKE